MADGCSGCVADGDVGVGKSVVAGEVYEQLVRAGRGSAWIDLGAIAHCDTEADTGGFFGSVLMVENLASIWPNYRRRGVDKLVLSRAVPSAEELARLQAALPAVVMTVCLLTATPLTLKRRLRERDVGELADRRGPGAVALQDEMLRSGIADVQVANDDSADLSAVAAEVLRLGAVHD